MKKNELKVLKALNKHFETDKATLCPTQYHRFDAYNDNYIIEIKYRYKRYPEYIIEFDKYAYNKLYAEMYNKKFLYVVGVPEDENLDVFDVYIYNITHLDKSGYKYKWEERAMPYQTEFEDNNYMDKLVGYLEPWAASKQIVGLKED
jgi:hypothetical protein|tara:strand:- start:116 stop:556 length:441 start_codon:yes stop_codon:yes gene_type:complete